MAKKYVLVLGVVLVLIGILGFFNAFTTDGQLLGIFAVDTPHNIIHLASGLVALAAVGVGETYARIYAQVFGIIYALVTILGFMVGTGELLGLVHVNQADNVLHLLIAASALYVGFSNGKSTRKATA